MKLWRWYRIGTTLTITNTNALYPQTAPRTLFVITKGAATTGGGSCADTTRITLRSESSPEFTIVGDTAACIGETITLIAQTDTQQTNSAQKNITWVNQEGTILGNTDTLKFELTNANAVNTIRCIATAEYGCTTTIERRLRVLPQQAIALQIANVATLATNDSVSIPIGINVGTELDGVQLTGVIVDIEIPRVVLASVQWLGNGTSQYLPAQKIGGIFTSTDTLRVQPGTLTLRAGYFELGRIFGKPLAHADTVARISARFVESTGLGSCNTITSDTAILTIDICGGPMRGALTLLDSINLVIAPNPAQDIIRIQANIGVAGNTIVNLRNVTGEVLYTHAENTFQAPFKLDHSINLTTIPAGVYTLELQTPLWRVAKMVVVE